MGVGLAFAALNLVLCVANGFLTHANLKLAAAYRQGIAQFQAKGPEDLSKYSLLHMPPSGKCPEGFASAAGIFMRDGGSYAGCARIGADPGSGMIDRIDPGESVGIAIPSEPPRRPDAPSVRQ
jgi:hypothetical protein